MSGCRFLLHLVLNHRGGVFVSSMKTCSKCKRELDKSCFVKSYRYNDQLHPHCKDCRRNYKVLRLGKNPLCSNCKTFPHLNSHPYCSNCLADAQLRHTNRTTRKVKPQIKLCNRCKMQRRENGKHICKHCRIMCPKCNLRERASSAVWCQVCINSAAKTRRVVNKGTWYKSRTPQAKEKLLARKAVHLAIQLGVLKRQPCEVCGKMETQGHHHEGYDKLHRLVVRWLCGEHHKALERWAKYVLTNRGLRVYQFNDV